MRTVLTFSGAQSSTILVTPAVFTSFRRDLKRSKISSHCGLIGNDLERLISSVKRVDIITVGAHTHVISSSHKTGNTKFQP